VYGVPCCGVNFKVDEKLIGASGKPFLCGCLYRADKTVSESEYPKK